MLACPMSGSRWLHPTCPLSVRTFYPVNRYSADVSYTDYSYNDVEDDEEMKHFTLNKAANTIQVLKDIASVNKRVQVHLVPWSPVSWNVHAIALLF
jgi:hypothetical protein